MAEVSCVAPACPRPIHALGRCAMHYHRMRRSDPEQFAKEKEQARNRARIRANRRSYDRGYRREQRAPERRAKQEEMAMPQAGWRLAIPQGNIPPGRSHYMRPVGHQLESICGRVIRLEEELTVGDGLRCNVCARVHRQLQRKGEA